MSTTNNRYAEPLSVLEVHLDAVARNYLFFQKQMKKGADCAAVVKADAYGLGAVSVSRALFEQNCRHFFVATFDEAVQVQQALPAEALIYILNGPSGASAEDFAENRFIPVLNTLGEIGYWNDFSRRRGKKQPCLIHMDTGMNRLGLAPEDVARTKESFSALDVRYVMSHLACADEPNHPKNQEQLRLFKKLSGELAGAFRYSFANSAGILLGADFHFDLARPGCGLYGINPSIHQPNLLQGVVTLKARILQIRMIDSPATVGYGAHYRVSSPVKCATVSAGYADGYLRSLTDHGSVFIGGEKCPVIGRVSMDSIVVDVTAVKQTLAEGDWAEIIGPHRLVDGVAKEAGTIGYEILTSLGRRYKRVYT